MRDVAGAMRNSEELDILHILEGQPQYEFVKELGKGATCCVVLARERHPPGQMVGIKFIARGW